MNVDNGIHVYRYDGSGPLSTTKDRDPLFDCFWLPGVTDDYPDRGGPVSPAHSKARMRAAPVRRAASRPRARIGRPARAQPEGRRVAGVDDRFVAEREKDKGSFRNGEAAAETGAEAPGRRRARGRALAQRAAQGGREEAQGGRGRREGAPGGVDRGKGGAAAPARDVATMAPDELGPQGAEKTQKKLKQVEELDEGRGPACRRRTSSARPNSRAELGHVHAARV